MVIDTEAKATQAAVGDLLGISRQAVGDLVRRGVLPENGTVGEWVKAYCANLREQAAGRGGGDEGSLVAERTRLAKAQADKTELEVETMRGNLLPLEEHERIVAEIVTAAKSRLLALPVQIVAETGRREVEEPARRMVYQALKELAQGGDDGPSDASESAGPAPLDPADRADGDGVGKRKPATQRGKQRGTRAVQQRPGSVPKGNPRRGK